MMHPTSSPIITDADFIIGEPNLSHNRIVTNTENPRPGKSQFRSSHHPAEISHTDVLRGAPRQRVRCSKLRADSKKARSSRRIRTRPAATSPSLKSSTDQTHANQHDGRTGDDGREDLPKSLRREERQGDFNERTAGCRTKERTVGLWAGELGTICSEFAVSVRIHLRECSRGDGDDGEGGSDNRDETSANVVLPSHTVLVMPFSKMRIVTQFFTN